MPDDLLYDVFISYKREDQAAAESLRARLITWGFCVWMDVYNIPPGAHWPDAIEAGLKASRVVVGLMSPRAVASRNVKNEWDWAIVYEKPLLLMLEADEINPWFVVADIPQEPAAPVTDFRSAFDQFDGRVLLLGEPGAGKTITLLHFTRDMIVQRRQNRATPLPILAQISSWDAQKQPPLVDWLAGTYNAPPDARTIIAQGRALLLLDGLDELGGEREDPQTKERFDPRRRFVEALANLTPRPPLHAAERGSQHHFRSPASSESGSVEPSPLHDIAEGIEG